MPSSRPRKRSEPPRPAPVEHAIEHCRVFVDGVMQRGEYRPAEAVRMARTGEIVDAKTLIALLLAADLGLAT